VFLLQTDGLSKHMDAFTNIISLLNVKERPFYVPISLQKANSNQANSSRFLWLPHLYTVVSFMMVPY
jgi:CCR4-NOT transcription complex subunit 1